MQPLDRAVRQAILDANPKATAEDIDEYEGLLADRCVNLTAREERALGDPGGRSDLLAGPDVRMAELRARLFPGALERPST